MAVEDHGVCSGSVLEVVWGLGCVPELYEVEFAALAHFFVGSAGHFHFLNLGCFLGG